MCSIDESVLCFIHVTDMEASPWEAAPLRLYLRSTMSTTQ